MRIGRIAPSGPMVLAGAAALHTPAADVPFPKALEEANVTLSSMADPHREGLIVGNGDLYGIVWERNGVLTMRVTKNDIWDARVDTSKDGKLPKVDIATGKITGPTGAPPSYKLPYPHPCCAAALRLGDGEGGADASWRCIRNAPKHGFSLGESGTSAAMHVAGQGASTGYSAALPAPVDASTFKVSLRGTLNAKYYVNVYDSAGKAVLGSGWKQSPTEMTDIELPFRRSTVGRVELYAMTADGKRAENEVGAVALSGAGGDVPISLAMPAPEAVGSLDLRRGVVRVKRPERPDTTVRVLADRNVVLIRGPGGVALEPVSVPALPTPKTGETDGVRWLHMVMPGDVDYDGMSYALAVTHRGDLKAVSLVTSFDDGNGDVLKRAIALARDTVRQQEAALVATHETAWDSFWSRSGVHLGDDVLQRWWYRTMYFARTVCKPGTAPVGIMPPLATDSTPWHADYHHNYNTWQAFWPLPAANHPELADPWISYNHSMISRYRFLAQETYGIDGVHVPISSFLHEPDPANCQSRNKRQMSMNPWGLTIGLQGMTLQSMWQKYLCDHDVEYMRGKIYPFLKEVATFYVSFMEQCKKDDDGKILLGPSYSPEHGRWGIYNCPFDVAYVHYAFDALIQAAAELKQDQELMEECRTYKALLPDYPTTPDTDGQPVVVDWEGCGYKAVRVHNITVPASPVFPADQVTWFSPEAEKELFRRTMQDTQFNGNNSHVMFNIAKARLSMMDGFAEGKKWFMSRELPNGFFVWQGHAHGTYMGEMIGVAGLVNEYLLQSVDNKIRLFPCWPADKDGAFTRLRAQGGFLVSAEIKQGKVVSATIESLVGKELQLLSPWPTIHVNGKGRQIGPDRMLRLETRPGQAFLVTGDRQ